jgi:hypothetical protein
MEQRDGVTAVTATRYPLPAGREEKGEGAARLRAAGAVGVRRHAVTAVIRCAPELALSFLPRCPGAALSGVAAASVVRRGALVGFTKRSPARALKRRERNNCARFLVVFSFCF